MSNSEIFISIFGWGLCILSWLICAPIMTYWFIKLYRNKNEIMIYKRYPITTLCTYSVVMMDVILQKPLFILYNIRVIGDESYYILFVSLAFLPLVYYGFTYGILWKFYLLFYEINYSKEAMNNGWKNIINHDENTGLKSWFLKHHETYGNFHWISKRFILSTIICIIISYTLWTLGIINWSYVELGSFNGYGTLRFMRIATLVDLFLISLPLICMFLMYFNIPAFYDYFSVRDELKLSFIILIIYYIAIIIIQLEIVWIQIFGEGTLNSRWYALCHTTVTIICEFSIILVQTLWTLTKLEPYLKIRWERTKSKIQMQDMVLKASQHNDDLQDAETAMNTRANSDIATSHSLEINTTSSDGGGVDYNNNSKKSSFADYQLTLHDVLSKKESFDAFMLHIVKEFSVEILVSYVEV